MKIPPLAKLILRATPAIFLVAATWLISSCANGPSGGAPAPAASMPWNRPTGPEGAGPLARLGNTSTAGLRSGDASYKRAASPHRPGLGTGWGNSVNSRVGYSQFKRASSKPAGVSSIYYNDSEGVRAMAGSWKYSGSGMQSAAGGLVEWGVKGSWGSLKNYHAKSRRYIVGRKGSNYSLVVKNICHSRLEVVLSVDGLDVMDGKSASFRKRGYIIEPGKTLTVKGFRTSQQAVAAFKFSSVAGSYTNQRHGKTRNVGVIGMAVFTQKGVSPWRWSRSAVQKRHGANPFAEAPPTRAR